MTYLERFQEWLQVYPRKREIVFLLVLMVLMEITILTLHFSLILSQCNCSFVEFVNAAVSANDVGAISVVEYIIFALIEEVIFRIIPLYIALRLWGVRVPTLMVLIVSSIIFALVHNGLSSLFVQGPGGFFYGLLFIKYGMSKQIWVRSAFAVELKDRYPTLTRIVYAGAMVTLIHASYNTLLTVIIYVLAGDLKFPPLI